jgi:hypothetical protein
VWVVDLLSREGTWVNGTRVSYARLRTGDRLRFGCYELDVQTREAAPALPAPRVQGAAAPAAPSLPVQGGLAAPAVGRQAALAPPGASGAAELLPILQQFGLFQQQMLEQFQQSLMLMLQTFAKMNSEQMDLIRGELAELRRLTEELQDARGRLEAAPPPAPSEDRRPRPAASPTNATSAPAAPGVGQAPLKPLQPSTPPEVDVHDWLSGRIANLESQREGVLKRVFKKLTGG